MFGARTAVAVSLCILVSSVGLGAETASPSPEVSNTPASASPNIVLILADDLGYADLGVHGSRQISTPHIDSLARDGVRFTAAYASAPVCGPSRAGLMTGRNQVRFGFDNNLVGPGTPGFDPAFLGLPVEETTIADEMKRLGYVTGLVGKWHLGEAPKYHPTKRGFDEHWGFPHGGHDYFTAKADGGGYKAPLESNFKTPGPITYLTDDIGSECVDFITRHKAERFFLFASFNAPHAPLQAREDDLKRFERIEDVKRRTYCAMVYRFDQNVGRILKALEDAGCAENTLVVFLSDNGGPNTQNTSINAPLRGQKGILLEGGIRVPFIMKWPGRYASDKVFEHTVSALDLFPTFVSAACGQSDARLDLDGVDLTPFLTGQASDAPHASLCWRFTISAAIRDGDWKLVRLPDRLPMLYHLPTDISEQEDVSLENLERTRTMLRQLGVWDVKLPHPLFLEGAEWKYKQLQLYDRAYILEQPE